MDAFPPSDLLFAFPVESRFVSIPRGHDEQVADNPLASVIQLNGGESAPVLRFSACSALLERRGKAGRGSVAELQF